MSRRAVTGVGVLLACLYLLGVLVSGHLDPLDRRPILDGLAPPPPYEWVAPPSALAPTNQAPAPKTFQLSERTATYDPTSGSAAGVFASGNYQVTLALSAGALPPAPGAHGALITMTPLAPASHLSIPHGYKIAGNVVQIIASYSPAGGPIGRLAASAQLTLAYPRVYGIDSTILTSADGQRWLSVPSGDHLGQQLVVGSIHRLGFFAVGQKSVGGDESFAAGPSSHTSSPLVPILVLVGLVLAALAIALAIRAREPKNQPPRRRPPPRDEDPFDPWKT